MAGSTVTDGSCTGSLSWGWACHSPPSSAPDTVTARSTSAEMIWSEPCGPVPAGAAQRHQPEVVGDRLAPRERGDRPFSGTDNAVRVCRKPFAPSTTAVAVALMGSVPVVVPWSVVAPAARVGP